MQIESAIDRGEVVEAVIDGTTHSAIPKDPVNRHYAAILAWQAAGGSIQEAAGPDLEVMRQEAKWAWTATVKRFREFKPDASIRYDADLLLNLANAKLSAIAAGQAVPAPVAAVEAWTGALIAHYYAVLDRLSAAIDLATLEAIDTGYDGLEALFGVAGSQLADPDVSTRDLLGIGA